MVETCEWLRVAFRRERGQLIKFAKLEEVEDDANELTVVRLVYRSYFCPDRAGRHAPLSLCTVGEVAANVFDLALESVPETSCRMLYLHTASFENFPRLLGYIKG